MVCVLKCLPPARACRSHPSRWTRALTPMWRPRRLAGSCPYSGTRVKVSTSVATPPSIVSVLTPHPLSNVFVYKYHFLSNFYILLQCIRNRNGSLWIPVQLKPTWRSRTAIIIYILLILFTASYFFYFMHVQYIEFFEWCTFFLWFKNVNVFSSILF